MTRKNEYYQDEAHLFHTKQTKEIEMQPNLMEGEKEKMAAER